MRRIARNTAPAKFKPFNSRDTTTRHVQITADGHRAYLEAVEDAFGMEVDFAQLQKIYGAPSDEEARR